MWRSMMLLAGICAALPMAANADVRVDGYYRSDGTYVQPHYRSEPDRSRLNNWSTKGNTNPHTGKRGTKPRFKQPDYGLDRGW